MEKKRGRVLAAGLTILCTALSVAFSLIAADIPAITGKPSSDAEKPIRWVEFNIPYDVLKKAMDIDIETYDEPVHVDWTDVLAYLGARYGGDFTGYKAADMDSFVSDIKGGRSVAALTKDMKYFDYYHKAYSAVLGGMLGEYQIRSRLTARQQIRGSPDRMPAGTPGIFLRLRTARGKKHTASKHSRR